MNPRLALLLIAALALSACSGAKKPGDNRTAQGEVLEASVSDAMLPLDTVRSQAPLAPKSAVTDLPAKGAKTLSARPAAGPAAAETTSTAGATPAAPSQQPDTPADPAT